MDESQRKHAMQLYPALSLEGSHIVRPFSTTDVVQLGCDPLPSKELKSLSWFRWYFVKCIEDKSPPSLQLVPPSISFVDPSPFRIATGNYESQLEALFRRGRPLLSPLVTVLVVACNHRNANAMQKRRDYRNELTGDIFEYRINSLFNQHSREVSIWILRSSPPRIIIKSYRYRNRNQQASFVHYSAFFLASM